MRSGWPTNVLARAVGAWLLLLTGTAVRATPPRTVGFRESARVIYGHAPVGLVLGDLNRDGRPDAACANDDSTVTTLIGNGAGELPVQYDRLVGSAVSGIALGNFDHDEFEDL